MGQSSQNPMFYILEASPERYIKKPSSTIVMLIRLLEGAVALSLLFRVAGYLSGLFHGTSPGVFELLVKLQSGQLLSGGQVQCCWDFGRDSPRQASSS